MQRCLQRQYYPHRNNKPQSFTNLGGPASGGGVAPDGSQAFAIVASPFNAASIVTDVFDFEASYQFDLEDMQEELYTMVVRISGNQGPMSDTDATIEVGHSPDKIVRDARRHRHRLFLPHSAIGPVRQDEGRDQRWRGGERTDGGVAQPAHSLVP